MAPEEAQRGGRASLADEAPKFHWRYPHGRRYLRASDVVCLYVDTVPFLLLSV